MSAGDDIDGDGVFNDFYTPRVTDDPVFDPLCEGDVRFAVRPNSLRGDPYFQADLRLQKNFQVAERFTISPFADLFWEIAAISRNSGGYVAPSFSVTKTVWRRGRDSNPGYRY